MFTFYYSDLEVCDLCCHLHFNSLFYNPPAPQVSPWKDILVQLGVRLHARSTKPNNAENKRSRQIFDMIEWKYSRLRYIHEPSVSSEQHLKQFWCPSPAPFVIRVPRKGKQRSSSFGLFMLEDVVEINRRCF